MNRRNSNRPGIAQRQRLVAAVQRIERPMTRRVRGNPGLNGMLESACDGCGYLMCSCPPCSTCGELRYYCRGHYAHEAPKPSPAPVVERRFSVGQRVRVTDACNIETARGHIGTVKGIGGWVELDNSSLLFAKSHLEPVEPLTAERGAQESDEALLLRAGWRTDGAGYVHEGRNRIVFASSEREGKWCHGTRGTSGVNYATTLLQAACAALGIELRDNADRMDRDPWEAWFGGASLESGPDAESCARAAVEAWSAMQREGA